VSFASATDRINRACERTFGEVCTLAGVSVTGIYQAPFVEAFGVSNLGPTFKTRTANLPAVPNGQQLVVPGTGTFRVQSHQPDGAGWSTLVLEVV